MNLFLLPVCVDKIQFIPLEITAFIKINSNNND